jgi:hypothetical protein
MEMAMRNRDGERQAADSDFEGWCMGVQLQNVRRYGDGSIDYDFYERRMRELRSQCLAEIARAAWRGCAGAFKAAADALRQTIQARPSALIQKR